MPDLNTMMRGRGGPGSRFQEAEHAEHVGVTLKRIWKYFSHEKIMLFTLLAIVVCGTLCSVFAPSQQSNAIDVIAGEREGSLAHYALLMFSAYLIYCIMQMLQGTVSARLSCHIVRRMREELFGKLIDLPVSYLDFHSHGDLMSRMTNDIENISTTVSQALPTIIAGMLTIAGTAAIMLWYCPPLAALTFCSIFLTYFATKILSKNVRKYSRSRQELLGKLNGTTEEMISGYRTVVSYNQQEETIRDFCRTADELTKAGIRTDVFSGVMGPIMNCIGNITFVIIAAFGGWFSLKGWISVGVISAFIVYSKQFSRPINEIAQVYGQLQTAIAGAERVFRILDEANEEMQGAAMSSEPQATVTFEHVHFSYRPNQPVIRDFSLKIPSGKKIALVGATGSGKTTIVNLLLRFYDPDSGRICINGTDITTISREALRKEIAIVLQDTVLFRGSIFENICFANAAATEQDVALALERSQCTEMLNALPDGIHTELTSGGSNLSQGQRQLLSIARAFVADPKILILDEATSNVDTRTEKVIQNAMYQLMENRTSIVIAHRLSTIRNADVIIVMDNGQIVESGTHEQLLARKGKYYNLYQIQYAGFAT